jgi:hypothetical protein
MIVSGIIFATAEIYRAYETISSLSEQHLNPHHCSIVLSESDPSTFPSLVKTPSAQTISNLHLHLNVSIILEIRLLQFDPAEDLAQVRLLKAFALFANTHEQHAQ